MRLLNLDTLSGGHGLCDGPGSLSPLSICCFMLSVYSAVRTGRQCAFCHWDPRCFEVLLHQKFGARALHVAECRCVQLGFRTTAWPGKQHRQESSEAGQKRSDKAYICLITDLSISLCTRRPTQTTDRWTGGLRGEACTNLNVS